jgi:hypothetical protein
MLASGTIIRALLTAALATDGENNEPNGAD